MNYFVACFFILITVGNKLDMSTGLLKKCEENGFVENLLVNVAKMKEFFIHDLSRSLINLSAIRTECFTLKMIRLLGVNVGVASNPNLTICKLLEGTLRVKVVDTRR